MGRTHWSDTNRVMLRNRRIGCSVSGIAQFITNRGIDELRTWLEEGYDTIQDWDKEYSDWRIPKSIKTTSVKPSGSIFTVQTPGLHYQNQDFTHEELDYQSIRIGRTIKEGYKIEPIWFRRINIGGRNRVDVGEGIRTVN